MKFSTNIHRSQMPNPTNFGEPLSSIATMRFTFVVLSERLLDGLSLFFVYKLNSQDELLEHVFNGATNRCKFKTIFSCVQHFCL